MTTLSPNAPIIMWSAFLGLWVAFLDGFYGTGDDKEEAAAMWLAIYESTTRQIPTVDWTLTDF